MSSAASIPPRAAAPAPPPPATAGSLLGEILTARHGVKPKDIEAALARQAETGARLGEILIEQKAATAEQIIRALGEQLELTVMLDIPADEIPLDLIRELPITFAKQFNVIPLRRESRTLTVITADPLQLSVLDDLGLMTGCVIEPVLSTPERIVEAINKTYDRKAHAAEAVMDDIRDDDSLDSLAHEVEEIQDLLDVDDEAPIIRLVNTLMAQAVNRRASDIHIEPAERDMVVRFRIDGQLYEVLRPPKGLQAAVTSRVKIMAGLNIAEKRLPQDGRIRIKIAGKDVDIRVSSLPTNYGERIVLRLLDRTNTLLDLNSLGFAEDRLTQIRRIINKSHGIVLVTGPTGSGKTTTLYSALAEINQPDINILTVEDPVEYQLPGIGQIQVQAKIGLTFVNVLRSILRQDPDVILIGETRDLETAEIAIQASLTGHLVFSTLHTNDAASSVTRLVDMGVEPFLVASSLIAVLAQRLVRRVCPECRQSYTPTAEALAEVGLRPEDLKGPIYRARGCSACHETGYQGREGIYELLTVTDEIRQLIVQNVDAGTLKKQALKQGMKTLRDDGARKVTMGVTTIEEVLRVTQDDTV
ncbi:MAG: Type II secretion system protein E [Myxococcota bacterium]|nr:Type II secretion system protein E [Myxococcota bacterium]